jgi:methyl-accepting chemotaxis protein
MSTRFLSIRARVGAALAVLLALTGLMSLAATFSLNQRDIARVAVQQNAVSVRWQLGSAKNELGQHRVYAMNRLLATPDAAAEADRLLDDIGQRIESRLHILDSELASDIEQASIRQLKTRWRAYLDATRKAVSAWETLGPQGAVDLYNDAAGPLASQVSAILVSLTEMQPGSATGGAVEMPEGLAGLQTWHVIGGFALTLVASFVVAHLVSRSARRQVSQLNATIIELSRGNTHVEVPRFGGDLAPFAAGLSVFKDLLARQIEYKRIEAERRETSEERARAVGETVARFEAVVARLAHQLLEAAEAMEHTAGAVSDYSSRSIRQAGSVAEAVNRTSDEMVSAADATRGLAELTAHIRHEAALSSNVATEAVGIAQASDDTVRQLARQIDTIGQVVQLIGEVAGQTNLLALNATIEAARAGEAGRGFAVVASEVKSLAGQTSRATEAIETRITSVQQTANAAVAGNESMRAVIARVDAIAASINQAVEGQAASFETINDNVRFVSDLTRQIGRDVDQLQAVGAEATDAAARARESAVALTGLASELEAELAQFIARIKAA